MVLSQLCMVLAADKGGDRERRAQEGGGGKKKSESWGTKTRQGAESETVCQGLKEGGSEEGASAVCC